jgi:hypothetical protein
MKLYRAEPFLLPKDPAPIGKRDFDFAPAVGADIEAEAKK